MTAYYNEYDPKAAAWLRELIRAGLIAPGDVDERSIKDVKADDLERYTQCHFFAGIGGWSYALRLAQWSDASPVWTGSCPCQPYSSAGKQRGDADERNLWPDFFRLIAECRPKVVFGEQVASADVVGTQLEADFISAFQSGDIARANKIADRICQSLKDGERPEGLGRRWLDGISADLEGDDYSVRATVLGAHSVGAPHIRQRLYWVADSRRIVGERRPGEQRPAFASESERDEEGVDDQRGGAVGVVADARHDAQPERPRASRREGGEWTSERCVPGNNCATGRVDDAETSKRRRTNGANIGGRRTPEVGGSNTSHWDGVEFIPCRDGKARRVAPGVPLLAHGIPGRVAQLRGLGNAIVPQVAAAFIEAYLEFATNNEINNA